MASSDDNLHAPENMSRGRLEREVRRQRAGWEPFVICGWCNAGMIWKRDVGPAGYDEMELAGCDNPECEKYEKCEGYEEGNDVRE